MVINLVKEDLQKILDKNALLMALMAFLFAVMSTFIDKDTGNYQELFTIMKTEGFLSLSLMFVIELSKSTLVNDKISKKIEFILANRVTKRVLIKKYFLSLYIGSFIIVFPSLVLSLWGEKLSVDLILNLSISSALISILVVYIILHMINMNKIPGLQIRMTLLMLLIVIISAYIYHITNLIELYLICKFFILILLIILLSFNTNKERIVVSYY